jgi:hypothetical protein
MSKYVETIAEALIDVLNGAAGSRDHRIAGYAVNVDFWIAEIVHCVAVVDDFPKRQELFVDAVKRAADRIREAEIHDTQGGVNADPTQLLYGESPTSYQLENYLGKTARLRARLIEAATKFLVRMRNEGQISLDKWQIVKDQLPFL